MKEQSGLLVPSSVPYSPNLRVAGPQKTSVVISFSTLGAGAARAASGGGRGRGSSPACSGVSSQVESWGFCVSQRHAQGEGPRPAAQTLSEPWGYFPFLTVVSVWLLFHSVQNLVQGGEVPFTRPLQRLPHLLY